MASELLSLIAISRHTAIQGFRSVAPGRTEERFYHVESGAMIRAKVPLESPNLLGWFKYRFNQPDAAKTCRLNESETKVRCEPSCWLFLIFE